MFAPANEDLVEEILTKFEIDIHRSDYDENLINKFKGQTIPPEFSSNFLIYMLGWVTDEVHKYNKKGLPAIIASADYRKTLIAQCRMYNQKNSIPMLSYEITLDQIRTEVESQDIFMKRWKNLVISGEKILKLPLILPYQSCLTRIQENIILLEIAKWLTEIFIELQRK